MRGDLVLTEKTRGWLVSVPFFAALSDEALAMLAQRVVERRYRAGELVFLDGEAFAGLHIVIAGSVKLYSMSERGREHVLMVAHEGDSFNEVPLLDAGPNPVNCAALDDAVLWVLSREGIDEVCRRFPALREMMIANVTLRCRQLIKQICRLSFLSVTGRLAAFILTQSGGQPVLAREWTGAELAAVLGTVREVVSRSTSELQRLGLIEVNARRIQILDRDGLEDLAGF